jgi:hypothetical protein
MNFRTSFGLMMAALLLSSMPSQTFAEEPQPKAKAKEKSAIELHELEITGSLRDVVGSFKMHEMEITGSLVGPRIDYLLPWKDPIPFPETEVELARELIEPYYNPLDRETYIQQYDIATQLSTNSGPEQGGAGLFSEMKLPPR